jgi:sec-independent protein translocase protein TatB
MFDIGMPELIVIGIVALLVVGPKKLPEWAKGLGKGLGELKRILDDVKDSVGEEFKETTSGIREAVTEVKQQIESEVRETGKILQEVKEQVVTESEEINKNIKDTVTTGGSETKDTGPENKTHDVVKDDSSASIDKADGPRHTESSKPV